MSPAGASRNDDYLIATRPVRIFGLTVRLLWVTIVLLTVLSETLPAPQTTPAPFYAYVALKGVGFVLVGYLAPLAFWRFNALNHGVLYAVLSASLVESLQALIGHGHRFRWYELVLKLVLLLFGFIVALDARYERAIRLGPVIIRFEWPPHPRPKQKDQKSVC